MSAPSASVAATRRAVRQALADLPEGSRVLVAVSGGADSLALAAAAAHEGSRAGLGVAGVTVDHGLQPGSAAHASEVAGTLRRLGLDPVEVVSADVGTEGGPEAAARAARYAALDAVRDRLGAAYVLLGHTLDDQAETVLLGLARGSGARSLAGMARERGPYRRPMLGLDRATVRQAAADQRLPVWDDPHNDDPAYARARVRATLLPALEAGLGPGVAAALARTADLLRDDADALDAWATRALHDVRIGDDLDVARLEELPTAVRTRVLRQAAVAAGSPPDALTRDHVLALDALVTAWRGQGAVALPGPVSGQRRCGRLLLARSRAPRPAPGEDPQESPGGR